MHKDPSPSKAQHNGAPKHNGRQTHSGFSRLRPISKQVSVVAQVDTPRPAARRDTSAIRYDDFVTVEQVKGVFKVVRIDMPENARERTFTLVPTCKKGRALLAVESRCTLV